jgi:protein-disulfide isomerase
MILPRLSLFRLRPLVASLALAAGLGALAPASAQSGLTPDQRKAVEALVREVLVKNPEIIQEALAELDKRNAQGQAEAQAQALLTDKATLYDSPRHAVAGNPQGDVTLVEFFDYNCGYCKRSLEDLRSLVGVDPKLRVILKDFPILGPDSVEASRVAIAAKSQLRPEKFWEFHVKLMAQKGRVNGEKALEVAKESGADIARLRRDMEAPETRAAIEETVALGDRLSLTGTPAFVLANEVVFGAVGTDVLKAKINAVRQCGKTSC